MNAVISLKPQSSLLDEDTSVEVDQTEVQRAAMTVFEEMVDGGCGLRDCITAVYLAGMEKVTGAKPVKRSRKPAIPPCPYQSIVDLYHDHLHGLPEVQLLGPDRKKGIRKFWCWIFESRKRDSSRRAENAEQALAWVGIYFARAAQNDWLMGRSGRSEAHKKWQADIDYVVSPAGIKQVVEKTEAG